MDLKKRVIWISLFVISLVITYFFKVFPWILLINSVPFLYGMYLFLSFKRDFRHNIPWGIPHFILLSLTFTHFSKTFDKSMEKTDLSFWTIMLIKICFIIASVIVVKYLLNKRTIENTTY